MKLWSTTKVRLNCKKRNKKKKESEKKRKERKKKGESIEKGNWKLKIAELSLVLKKTTILAKKFEYFLFSVMFICRLLTFAVLSLFILILIWATTVQIFSMLLLLIFDLYNIYAHTQKVCSKSNGNFEI